MAERTTRRKSGDSGATSDPDAPGDESSDGIAATGFTTGAQATIDGYTGRYLVLLEGDASTATDAAVVSAMADQAGIKLATVGSNEAAAIDSRSISASTGLLFHELGVAVVNPAQDQLLSFSSAVAKSDDMRLMEAERFVYANQDIDINYLRGFRDAVNDLYDRITEPVALPGGTAQAAAVLDESQLTWGLQSTMVSASRETGRGVRVAILDTGIDLNHPDFRGRAILHQSFIVDEPVDDGHGHGTHCAGIACGPFQPYSLPRYGVAHEAELMVGKVLANSGRGTDSSILAGIQWAIANKADIVSMSLGARVAQGQNYSAIFEKVAQRALDRNVLLIAAAGNDSKRAQNRLDPVSHPGNCPSIMAVAAVDRTLRPGSFSNAGLNLNGGKVDIAGPGVDILSAWPGMQQYRREDGTSMATPFVAGIAALYAQRQPSMRGNALWAQLVRQAIPLQAPARDVGGGLVQAGS